jgi:hypothetical protein
LGHETLLIVRLFTRLIIKVILGRSRFLILMVSNDMSFKLGTRFGPSREHVPPQDIYLLGLFPEAQPQSGIGPTNLREFKDSRAPPQHIGGGVLATFNRCISSPYMLGLYSFVKACPKMCFRNLTEIS